MSDTSKSKTGRVVRQVLLYATPIPALARAVKAMKAAGKGIAAARPRVKAEAEADASPLDGMSPEERFHHDCVAGDWTDQDLRHQMGAFRAAKFAQLFVSLMMLPAILAVVMSAPWWVISFSVPALASFGVVMFAQALRHAWWQCQIDMRSMISFKEFMGRSDLFGRLFA